MDLADRVKELERKVAALEALLLKQPATKAGLKDTAKESK